MKGVHPWFRLDIIERSDLSQHHNSVDLLAIPLRRDDSRHCVFITHWSPEELYGNGL
jgi:hypothetical protein